MTHLVFNDQMKFLYYNIKSEIYGKSYQMLAMLLHLMPFIVVTRSKFWIAFNGFPMTCLIRAVKKWPQIDYLIKIEWAIVNGTFN